MDGTIIARTQSGSAYILMLANKGVWWLRVPPRGRMHLASSGWLPIIPRVVPGQRLFLGVLRTTPVDEVAFLPSRDVSAMPDAASAAVC
jgi:hypothetical protein